MVAEFGEMFEVAGDVTLVGDDTGVAPDRESTTSTPRWVKVFGIIALVLVLLLVILLFTRGPGGGHGPGRHTSSGSATPPSSVIELGGLGHDPSEWGY
ncbi:MAG: hypothetical protein ACRDTF_03185 [Pseudonocardiaceae bacterium]